MRTVSNELRPLHVYAEIPGPTQRALIPAPQVSQHHWHPAIATLLGWHGHPADDASVVDFLRLAVARQIDLSQLRYIGTESTPAWCVLPLASGPTAVCWQLSGGPPSEAATQAVDTLLFLRQQLKPAGVQVLQATVDAADRISRDICLAAGLSELATLHYLEKRLRIAPPLPMPPGYRFLPYSQETHRLFIQALEQSYVETGDCPELAGVRATADVLESHKTAGLRFDPDCWQLLMHEDDTVGVVLSHDSVRADSFEVGYLGLSKTYRGKGLGRLLLSASMHLAVRRKRPLLALALDASNSSASKLYYRAGMKRTQTRLAMWARL